MLGYVMVGTNDLARASRYYDTLLAELGGKREMESDSFIAWTFGDKTTSFSVITPFDGEAATVGNGVMMAFAAPDPATVDKIHALALELGGVDEGAPGPRPDFDPNFYVGYFRDPDGNKLNIFHYPTS